MNDWYGHIQFITKQRIAAITHDREAVLEAFIAKYGCEPERLIQIERRTDHGLSEWYVRRMTDEEMTERSLTSSTL